MQSVKLKYVKLGYHYMPGAADQASTADDHMVPVHLANYSIGHGRVETRWGTGGVEVFEEAVTLDPQPHHLISVPDEQGNISFSSCEEEEEEEDERLSITMDALDDFLNTESQTINDTPPSWGSTDAGLFFIHNENLAVAPPLSSSAATKAEYNCSAPENASESQIVPPGNEQQQQQQCCYANDDAEEEEEEEELSWFGSSSITIDDHFMIPDMEEEEDGAITFLELNWDAFI